MSDLDDVAIGRIERLARLHRDGALSDAEFAGEKARILGIAAVRPAASPPPPPSPSPPPHLQLARPPAQTFLKPPYREPEPPPVAEPIPPVPREHRRSRVARRDTRGLPMWSWAVGGALVLMLVVATVAIVRDNARAREITGERSAGTASGQ